jgi:hypothetical protein
MDRERAKAFDLDVNVVIPDGAIACDVIGVVKFVSAEGKSDFWTFNSSGLHDVECAGMALFLAEEIREGMVSSWYGGDDDEG